MTTRHLAAILAADRSSRSSPASSILVWGKEFNDFALKPYTAGALIAMPPGTAHFVRSKQQESDRPSGMPDWRCLAASFGQTVTSSLLRHWTMIGVGSVLRPVWALARRAGDRRQSNQGTVLTHRFDEAIRRYRRAGHVSGRQPADGRELDAPVK